MQIIDGKGISAKFLQNLKKEIEQKIAFDSMRAPELAVVLVGNDPASEIYVQKKIQAAKEVGIVSQEHRLPGSIEQKTLENYMHTLNNKENIMGILLQLPLPGHLDSFPIMNKISAAKDVDGLTTHNVGMLTLGRLEKALVPCTPLGCTLLLRKTLPTLEGLHALIIGRSALVGKPMTQLLLQENATVTVAHSKTNNLEALCAQADIIVAAVGKPLFVKASWCKKDATILDVGINRQENRIVGDVDMGSAKKDFSGHYTPVPGGVGPLTVACLLYNTYLATCRKHHFVPILAHDLL